MIETVSANIRSSIHHCPLGMCVIPSIESIFHWDGVLFIHRGKLYSVWFSKFTISLGYYADSTLKFRVTFPPNYPEQAPSVYFVTDVFHPLVSQKDGSFNVTVRFPSWQYVDIHQAPSLGCLSCHSPKEHHIFDVLHWIKASFKRAALDKLTEKDCHNVDAFRFVTVPSLKQTTINILILSECKLLLAVAAGTDNTVNSGITRLRHPL